MTTEEMNRVIAKWIGVDVDFDDNVYRDSRSPLRQYIDNKPKTEPLLFDISWDWLLCVWQKLRGELRSIVATVSVTNPKYRKSIELQQEIKEAITEEDTPTTAHRLMVEAIELIKK